MKAKFEVGQIVVVKTVEAPTIRIDNRQCSISKKPHWFYWEANKSVGYEENELRRLTNRECGDIKIGGRKPARSGKYD